MLGTVITIILVMLTSLVTVMGGGIYEKNEFRGLEASNPPNLEIMRYTGKYEQRPQQRGGQKYRAAITTIVPKPNAIYAYSTPTEAQKLELIELMTANMPAETREMFGKQFREVYFESKERPPVVTLDDIPHTLPYINSTKILKPTIHNGQRKLFNTELQFFTEYIHEHQNVYCIYAGAAPSNHTGFLSKLFPNITLILVDPNPFDIHGADPITLHTGKSGDMSVDYCRGLIRSCMAGGDNRIYIINDLFTENMATAIKELIPREAMYFVSDIRTNVSDGATEPDATDILWNLSQQFNWMSIMMPAQSMLKFRHPFYSENPAIFESKREVEPYKSDFDKALANGIDFAEIRRTHRLRYPAGTVYLQTYPGQSSTETRLVTDMAKVVDWGSPDDYENKLFYYNSIERGYGHHANANASDEQGFDHCNDCAVENLLWTNYISRYPIAAAASYGRNVSAYVKLLTVASNNRPLRRENHGYLYDKKYPVGVLIAANKYRNSNPNQQVTLFPVLTATPERKHPGYTVRHKPTTQPKKMRF